MINEPPVSGERAAPVRIWPDGPDEADYLPPFPGQEPYRPQVVIKPDLLPALSALSLVSLFGLPLGWLWVKLAPPQRFQVVQDARGSLPMPLESYHRFDAMAIFLLLGLAAGALTGAVAWLMRRRRGPVLLVAIAAGSALAAYLMILFGGVFAGMDYPVPGALDVGAVYTVGPKIESYWVLLAQPLGVFLAYGAATAWNGMDDLGRRLI